MARRPSPNADESPPRTLIAWQTPRPIEPKDPFINAEFREEIAALVMPLLVIEGDDPKFGLRTASAHSFLRSVFRGTFRPGPFPALGCGLCGVHNPLINAVEIRGRLFVQIEANVPRDPAVPHICRGCLYWEIGAADAAIRAALATLRGPDSETLRANGSTRRELRDGLDALVDAHLPHIDPGASCSVCGGHGDVLKGARVNVCPACMAAARNAVATAATSAKNLEDERVRLEYAKLCTRAEAKLVAKGKRGRVTPERDITLPVDCRMDDWSSADVTTLESEHPTAARIDEVGRRLASSIEAHVIASLRGGEEKRTGSRFIVEGASGLPMWTQRYLNQFRPSRPVAERLALAIFVMSELLHAGYGYTHQVEEFEWRSAMGHFALFHEIAERL